MRQLFHFHKQDCGWKKYYHNDCVFIQNSKLAYICSYKRSGWVKSWFHTKMSETKLSLKQHDKLSLFTGTTQNIRIS